jgi:hypothetical protein
MRRAWIAAVMGCGPRVELLQGESSSAGTTSTGAITTLDPSTDDGLPPPDPSTTSGADSTSTGSSDTTGAPPEGCAAILDCGADCLQWESFLQGDAGLEDWLDHVVITPDGTIVAAGQRDATGYDAGEGVVRSLDANGTILGDVIFAAGRTGVAPRTMGLAAAADGRIARLGSVDGPDTPAYATLDVYAPDGELVGSDVISDDTAAIVLVDLAFADDGSLVVGGRSLDGVDSVPVLRRYDSAVMLAWELALEMGDAAKAIDALAPAGNDVIVAASGAWTVLARIGLDTPPQWLILDTDFAGDSRHAVNDLALAPDGTFVAVGWQSEVGQWGVPWAVRVDGSDGTVLWSVTQGVTSSGPTELDSVVVDDEGRIFVAGVHMNDAGGRVRDVQQLDCDGASAWEWAHANDPGLDWSAGGGLAWSPALGLVVTGSDFLTEVDQRGFVARLVP